MRTMKGATPDWRVCFVAAVVLVGASMAMANAVDSGFTRAWPMWARTAWAVTLIAGSLGGVLLGMWSLELAGRLDPGGRAPDNRTFLIVYTAFVVLGVALPLGLDALYGISRTMVLLVYCGTTFLVTSLGRPWWLYATIRRMGWFSGIESDAAMRLVLALLGAALLLAGLFMDWRGP
jgi:hypothetical protein